MKANCSNCGKEFDRKKSLIERAKHPTCSQDCRKDLLRKLNEDKWDKVNCKVCGKETKKLKSREKYHQDKVCSMECRNKLISETHTSDKIEVECPRCGKYFKVFPYRMKQGKVLTCSRSCAYYMRFEDDKTKHPRYNENISDQERIDRRKLKDNVIWRDKVLERDNYTCQICFQYGGKLQAHHLNGYHWDKHNRLNIDNGVTLCKKCHKGFHKQYSNHNNTREQYIEYANLNRRL